MTGSFQHRHESRAKLLIIHADDLGMCHSVNSATFSAWEQGAITSASVMVACPWFPEVVEYIQRGGDLDLGVHITLTSEFENYKWRCLTPNGGDLGLLDERGYCPTTGSLVTASAEVVEEEALAQIDQVIRCKLRPTHIDCHMYAVFEKSELVRAYVNAARKRKLPFFLTPSAWRHASPDARDVLLDYSFHAHKHSTVQSLRDFYINVLNSLRPGISQLTVHLGFDDAEMRAIAGRYGPWGAAWRQEDFATITGCEFQRAIKNNNITLIRWGDLPVRSQL